MTDLARMTPEELRKLPTNPYPKGSYSHAQWNLDRALTECGRAMRAEFEKLLRRLGRKEAP